MYKRYAKYVDRAGDMGGDDDLKEDIYVPETLQTMAVDNLNDEEDEGPYECSICPGTLYFSRTKTDNTLTCTTQHMLQVK
jgi:hypothetical protein